MLMSLQPRAWPEPTPEVAAAVRATYRRRQPPLPVTIRDRLGELFPDAEFAAAFGARGRPGWSPGRLALVTVLQMAENLTDRQAAEAVRDKMSWKYALGLGLDDEGFDASVLSEFRTRVVEHGLEQRALDLVLSALVAHGLLGPGGRARTDSTHVICAVRDLNRLELAGESVRAAAEALAAAAPDWLARGIHVADWTARYGARIDSWRLPASASSRTATDRADPADLQRTAAPAYPPGPRTRPSPRRSGGLVQMAAATPTPPPRQPLPTPGGSLFMITRSPAGLLDPPPVGAVATFGVADRRGQARGPRSRRC